MAATRKPARAPRAPRARGSRPGGWWGDGPPPTETWPGVTITVDDGKGRFRFDAAQADRVCAWFPRYCSHSKGAFAGQKFELLPYQSQLILRPLFGWVREDDGLRRFRKAFIEIPKKQGKALALDTPIPTPGGWTTMEALAEGDLVFDDTGQPTRVEWASPVMHGRPCYRLSFSDGASIVADAEHQWVTRTLKPEGGRGVVTTEEIAATLLRKDGARNHSIEVMPGLQLPDSDLPVPPYVLGIWLADGDSDSATIVGDRNDLAVLDEMAREGYQAHRINYRDQRHPNVFYASRFEGLQSRLRDLGVLGHKHIPPAYLRASSAQRMALLQGLMDGDGHCTEQGQCELVTVKPALRDAYVELVRSLGFKASLITDRARLNGRDCGPRYRIQFWAFADRPVFRLARKRERLKVAPNRRPRSRSVQITGCEPVASVPVRCISVAAPSSLYLAGPTMLPTHNTQLIAGLALYMLLADNEPGAEVYVAAADREQARILFNAAKAMVEANAALAKRVVVYRNSIVRKDDPSAFFQVLSAEAATKHGPNIHCLIIDELHAQPDRELFETLTRGVISRRQPMILLITTAGDDEESIAFEEYDYARGVLSGTIQDEQHLPVIFEAKPDDDFQSPAVWRRVNPGLGVTVTEDAMRAFAVEAANEPRKRNDFLRYHLNRWVNQSTAWIPVDWWDACNASLPSEEELRKYPCVLGVDMSQKIDLTAASLVFMLPLPKAQKAESIEVSGEDEAGAIVKRRHSLNYQIAILPKFWLPEATLDERVKQDKVRYDLYEELGELETTEGVTIDPDAIVSYVKDETGNTRDLVTRFPLLKQGRIGYDPAFATVIGQRLSEMGLTTVEVLQGYKYLSEACMVLEALIKAGRVIHGGHRLLRSHVENVAVRRDDAGRIKPVKPKKSTKRIDGIVSVLIALSQLMVMPMPRPRTRGRGVGLKWTPQGFQPIAEATEGGEAHA